ncbi:glycoside hydrolase family 3 protein, partial [Sphaerotilus hippei]
RPPRLRQTTTGISPSRSLSRPDLNQLASMKPGAVHNTFITRMDADADVIATAHNDLQAMGEASRLGIPISISTDPRNSFASVAGQGVAAGSFSKWPQNIGLAALRDPAVTRRYAELVRQEYRAVGITTGLSPQADVSTEPRWTRIADTFGEDFATVSALTQAYVEGFQAGNTGINTNSVITVVKHWGGYGAQKDGLDSHNYYGRYMTFPGGMLDKHLAVYDGAIAAGAGGIMPTYSMPYGTVTAEGVTLEEVAAAYNKPLLTDLLRGKHNFKGVVVSDWGILRYCDDLCKNGVPLPASGAYVPYGNLAYSSHHGTDFGVESLTPVQKIAKSVNAGVDQFGGVQTSDRQTLIDAVTTGLVTEARVNDAVKRILIQKFQQGLFENPYVDVAAAKALFATGDHQAQANMVQSRSHVLLQNTDKLLPLASTVKKVYLGGSMKMDAAVVTARGFTVVSTPSEADVAILRVSSPYQMPFPSSILYGLFHEGNLTFEDGNDPLGDYAAIKAAQAAGVPVIVNVHMERPAILTNVMSLARVVLAEFGTTDDAVLDVLTGKVKPEGKLPFELPSSMTAVTAQLPDVPFDSAAPLFPFGFGLSY